MICRNIYFLACDGMKHDRFYGHVVVDFPCIGIPALDFTPRQVYYLFSPPEQKDRVAVGFGNTNRHAIRSGSEIAAVHAGSVKPVPCVCQSKPETDRYKENPNIVPA